MKKIIISFILSLILSLTVFAEGDIHIGGGKSCPQNQTCLVNTEPTKSDSNNSILLAVRNFLNLIF